MPSEQTDYCLVVLTDSLYLPGTIKLIDSWIRWNGECSIIALSRDPEAFKDPKLLSYRPRCVRINESEIAAIKPYKKRRSRRHAETFFKFWAFADFGFSRNLFLDSDILCVRAAPQLLQPSSAPLTAVADTGFKKTRAYKGHAQEINTGVMAIDRAIQGDATVRKLLAIAEEDPGRGGYNAGDQGIINKWIHRDSINCQLLTPDYNLLKRDYADQSGLDTCRLLHFVERKPWFPALCSNGPLPQPAPLEELWHNTDLRSD